jgi:hypothetical protein
MGRYVKYDTMRNYKYDEKNLQFYQHQDNTRALKVRFINFKTVTHCVDHLREIGMVISYECRVSPILWVSERLNNPNNTDRDDSE